MGKNTEILMIRIAQRLAELKITERAASLDATGKPDAIRYIKTRDAMPSAERLSKIAETLKTTPDWLLGNEVVGERRANFRQFPAPDLRDLKRDLPIYGTALGADLSFTGTEGELVGIEQTGINMYETLGYVQRPGSLVGNADAYVIIVAGYSMMPRFEPGRRLLINPKLPPRPGDDVIVQLKRPLGDDGDAELVAILLKTLLRQRPDRIVLSQYSPELTFEVPREAIHVVHRVQPWDDALGI